MTGEEIAGALASVESRCKSNTHRLDELERRQNALDELISTVKVLACRQETVETDVKEIKSDVKNLSGRPQRRFEAVADKLIYALLAAVLSFLLAQAGIV